jgi:hypothetical protein
VVRGPRGDCHWLIYIVDEGARFLSHQARGEAAPGTITVVEDTVFDTRRKYVSEE